MIPIALAIFTGAFLLFLVQPVIGKFILPWFGASPGAWSACLLFFQLLLLGGYAYADWSARAFKPRVQAAVHLMLVLSALVFLPILPDARWKPTPESDPAWLILALLSATIGLPYLVLSATGPMMQRWFVLLRPAESPYRLYALSNIGSLLALVCYPFVVEPMLTRKLQAVSWSWGFVLYAVFIAACAIPFWRLRTAAAGDAVGTPEDPAAVPPPNWDARLLWFLLPAVTSVLLMAVTNKMCQDVAVIPFLWILPLGIYLLSFVLCFDSPRWYSRGMFGAGAAFFAAMLCWMLLQHSLSLKAQIMVFSGSLFCCCMVGHGELYRLRPHPRRLTSFYLTISFGGAMGGVFVVAIAPHLFRGYYELHWGLVALASLLVFLHWRERSTVAWNRLRIPVWGVTAALAIALGAALYNETRQYARTTVERTRNFYGVLRVMEDFPGNDQNHLYILTCGETVHGIQFTHPDRKTKPLTYYSERSGAGVLLQMLHLPEGRRIGMVGLGVGTLATYAQKGDVIRFYEINPEVDRLARQYFSFLGGASNQVEVVMGDARISMEREAPQQYDVLVLDAFSSDAIPMHLLTREAFDLYRRHLKPGGVIAVHFTNRHLDLRPVLDGAAAYLGMKSAYIKHDARDEPWWILPSKWYLMTGDGSFLDRPEFASAVKGGSTSGGGTPLWTDDYTSLLRVLH